MSKTKMFFLSISATSLSKVMMNEQPYADDNELIVIIVVN